MRKHGAVGTRSRDGASRGRWAGADAGFSLIELLVGGFVLSFGIIGIAIMFGQGQTYLASEVDDRIGVGLAQQKIEALRALGFDCVPVAAGVENPDPVSATPPPVSLGQGFSDPDCPDTPASQAARKYTEVAGDHLPGDPEHGSFRFYRSRVTRVECIDPGTFDLNPDSPPSCGSAPLVKKITVDVTPSSEAARAVRVEALLAIH